MGTVIFVRTVDKRSIGVILMTNLDQIKSMTVEEYYLFLTGKPLSIDDIKQDFLKNINCDACPCRESCYKGSCSYLLSKWLKSEVEKDQVIVSDEVKL